MAEYQPKSVSWREDLLDSTSDTFVKAVVEDAPTLTVATILGVTIVILIAIVVVFALGVLLDCRHQKIMDQKISQVKLQSKRKGNQSELEAVSIANNVEDTGTSLPPAEVLRHIP